MFYYIKKVFKTILVILVLLAIAGMGYRYQMLKKEGKLDEVFALNKKNEYYKSEYSSNIEEKKEDNVENITKTETITETETTENEESTFVVEEKDFDGYYYKFNFDNRLLLYEGVQTSASTKMAIDILIEDVDDLMYSKPTVKFQNFRGLSTNEITADNLEQYKNVLNQAKNSLGNGTYTFSFEYGKLKARVEKIIITKN